MVIWNFRIKLLVCQSVSVSTLLNQQVRWNFLKISMKKLCELVVLSINHILSLWYMYLWWFACCNSYFTSHDELSFHKSYQVVMYGLFNMEMYSKAIFNVHRNTGDKILGGWSLFTQCLVTPTPAPVAQFFFFPTVNQKLPDFALFGGNWGAAASPPPPHTPMIFNNWEACNSLQICHPYPHGKPGTRRSTTFPIPRKCWCTFLRGGGNRKNLTMH
jgi:hypothetical protein